MRYGDVATRNRRGEPSSSSPASTVAEMGGRMAAISCSLSQHPQTK